MNGPKPSKEELARRGIVVEEPAPEPAPEPEVTEPVPEPEPEPSAD